MGDKETYNVFFSHYHKDEESIEQLKSLLQSKAINIKDSSIDSSEPNKAQNPDYIKSIIKPKIDWASTIIVLIGPETHSSEWVNWEIEYAHKQGKRIVGVFLHGAKESDTPEKLEDYGDARIGWNSNKVISAIMGEHTEWHDTDGNLRSPKWTTSRSNC